MTKLKAKDEVIIIAGKDKGFRGVISRVLANGKCFIKGANLVKKHQKPNPNQGIQGGILEKEAPIDISNVAVWNPKTSRADRIKFEFRDGKKVRLYKSDNTPVGDS